MGTMTHIAGRAAFSKAVDIVLKRKKLQNSLTLWKNIWAQKR